VTTSMVGQLSGKPKLVPILSCIGIPVLAPDVVGCGPRRALLFSCFLDRCSDFDGSDESVLSGYAIV
jgi:hypothetical protein